MGGGEYVFKSPGRYEIFIPKEISSVYVTACGGGAGGITCGAYNQSPSIDLVAGNGGDTKVGNLVIAGGKGATATLRAGNVMNVLQPQASVPNGVQGEFKTVRNVDFSINGKGFSYGVSSIPIVADVMNNIGYYAWDGGGGGYTTYYAQTGGKDMETFNVFGAGGGTYHYFDSDGTSNQIGVAGNSGAFVSRQRLDVIPGTALIIEVGAGGKHAFYSNDGDGAKRFRVSDGTNGFVKIEFGGKGMYLMANKK